MAGPWIVLDLETTGLDPIQDEILEIGALHLDNWLNELATFHAVCRSRYLTPIVNEYVELMHRASGLWSEVPQAKTLATEWDTNLSTWLRVAGASEDCKAHLCGFSVHFDLGFIRAQLPKTSALVSHRCIDVSAWKVLGAAWGELDPVSVTHRALEDCDAAVEVLAQIRDHWAW